MNDISDTKSVKVADWVHTEWGHRVCTYLANRGGSDPYFQEELIFLDSCFGINR